jgi:DNA-binding response OmpR family regulator
MLPDISGFDVCSILTSKYNIPIIMLTARNDIVDKVLGLELGADDYITKPFDIREVAARVKVALRRIDDIGVSRENPENIIWVNNIKIDKSSRTVYKLGSEIKLKPREYDLLITFCDNKNRVLTREQLLDIVWDIDYEGDLRTVDVHVQRLRKKLDGDDGQSIIDTVFGVGYKMRCSE